MKMIFKFLLVVLFFLAAPLGSEEVNAQNFPKVHFSQVGPVGGGFPNVVTWDPKISGRVYFGSDVGGTGFSDDFGKTFTTAARGLGYQTSHEKIAALNAIDVNGTTVIAGGTGFRSGGGEVISSVDNGANWVHDSSAINFSAQNSAAPLPTGRPRSTDPSLIQWISGSTWVAGTYDEGVWISNDNRKSWKKLDKIFTGKNLQFSNLKDGGVFVRAMAKSPREPNTFYVGLWGDHSKISYKGLWRVTLQKSNEGFEYKSSNKVKGVPDVVESMVALDNRLYLACGRFGVRKYLTYNQKVKTITPKPNKQDKKVMYTAIHGVEGDDWSNDRVVLGTADGEGAIWLSDNSGEVWDNTTDKGIIAKPWGNNNEPLLVFKSHPKWRLGKEVCDVAAIQISPHDPEAWVVCSTSAIWTTENSGKTWRPADGFQILTYRDVDVSQKGTIAVGNVDHDALVSTDGGANWTSVGFDKVTVGHAVEFSPDGSELAFSNNERDNNTTRARLGVASSPATPSEPERVELGESQDVNGKDPTPKRTTGLAWVAFPKGTQRLIAAVDGGGIQTYDRPANSKKWSNPTIRTTEFMKAQSNGGLRTSVATDGERYTFVYDRKTGVWRTNDWGSTWTKIYPESGTEVVKEDQGYLAYDKKADKLYLSTPKQVFRIDNAKTSTKTHSLNIERKNPGAMALDPFGGLIVFSKPLGSKNSDTKLFRIDNPKKQGKWRDISDDTFKQVAPVVVDIAVSADRIIMPTRGKGILISEPFTAPMFRNISNTMLDAFAY